MKALGLALVLVVLGLTLVSVVPNPASAADCQYVLGFSTLHKLIPDIVGDCKTDQRYNPQNGDSLQDTTKGLLVWRKADNFTAFTDGYRSWVNGPNGLQQRLNTQRFDWEAKEPKTVTRQYTEMDGYNIIEVQQWSDGTYTRKKVGEVTPFDPNRMITPELATWYYGLERSALEAINRWRPQGPPAVVIPPFEAFFVPVNTTQGLAYLPTPRLAAELKANRAALRRAPYDCTTYFSGSTAKTSCY